TWCSNCWIDLVHRLRWPAWDDVSSAVSLEEHCRPPSPPIGWQTYGIKMPAFLSFLLSVRIWKKWSSDGCWKPSDSLQTAAEPSSPVRKWLMSQHSQRLAILCSTNLGGTPKQMDSLMRPPSQ